MEEGHKEMQLLSCTAPHAASSPSHDQHQSWPLDQFQGTPSLDLQLSISVSSSEPPSECVLIRKVRKYKEHHVEMDSGCVEALKWEAAEQIRLAAMEKAYAERVRELTRREMELAQSEFARARHMWERAREEVERAERIKERATHKIIDDSSDHCMEITCHSCRHKFLI